MRFEDLFTVPKGHKVTEKHLHRVLISSICSILLCMACLAGTTWAWFTVSIENTGNEICIGAPEVTVKIGGASYNSNVTLDPTDLNPDKKFALIVEHANTPDDVQRRSTLYVTFSLDGDVLGYVMLNHENEYTTEVIITTDKECSLSWTVSWFKPDIDDIIYGEITIVTEGITESTGETTVPESTESNESVPSDPTDPESTESKETASSEPAEPTVTESTGKPTESTETETDSTETTESESTEHTDSLETVVTEP